MNAIPNPPIAAIAPIAPWRIAAIVMRSLAMLFGTPKDVAEQHTLLKQPYVLLRTWLRVAEALMRRLLIIEASAFPKPDTPPRLWPRRRRVPKLRTFFPDKPQDWRVSFRCFASTARRNSSPACGGSGSRRSRETKGDVDIRVQSCASPSVGFATTSPASGGGVHKPKRFFDAWPLAKRYEVLRRVFNEPIPFARRLAKRLHALPHRLREVMRAPKDAHHKIGDDEWADLGALCARAWPPDSS